MLLDNPQPLSHPQSIAPQLSRPMDLRKTRFGADPPRPKLGLTKILALKEALKGKRGQHH